MRKLLLSAMAFVALSAQSAFAMNLTFQFDVNSSGPSLYACNAGIKHGAQANICFDRRDATKSCTQGCAAGNVNACQPGTLPADCVCTGEYDPTGFDGNYRMDFLQATTADWSDNELAATSNVQNHNLIADAVDVGASFNQLYGAKGAFPVNAAYKRQIKSMSVNLGSELYGAEYFVDICYRGPQIDYTGLTHNAGERGLNFNLKAKATVIDLKKANGEFFAKYHEAANLKVSVEARCIMDDSFNYCLADILPGETAGCGAIAKQDYTLVGKSGEETITSANVLSLINKATITAGTSESNVTPRFCQIRYTFKETNKSMRKWKLQRARICTYTEISESSGN